MTRATIAEALGTGFLLYVIVGSGIAAENLASDPGAQLFTHAIAVGLGLAALIAMFQPVSGSHFNPAVTLAFWRTRSIDGTTAASYAVAQIVGAFLGVVAAHLSFGENLVAISSTDRGGYGPTFSEATATFVLVLLILGLVQTHRTGAVPAAVGAWVACVVFATVSTGFANPAVTIARIFTDTYTGIGPASAPAFLAAQIAAGLAAAVVAPVLFVPSQPQPTNA